MLFLATWLLFPNALQVGDPTYQPVAATWANRGTCAASTNGQQRWITDVGGFNGSTYTGSEWRCNGTSWVPVGGELLLCTFVSETNETAGTGGAEVIMAPDGYNWSCEIPAGMPRAGSRVYGQYQVFQINNNQTYAAIRYGVDGCVNAGTCAVIVQRNDQTTNDTRRTHFEMTYTATNAQYIGVNSASGGYVSQTSQDASGSIDSGPAATDLIMTVQGTAATDGFDRQALAVYFSF